MTERPHRFTTVARMRSVGIITEVIILDVLKNKEQIVLGNLQLKREEGGVIVQSAFLTPGPHRFTTVASSARLVSYLHMMSECDAK